MEYNSTTRESNAVYTAGYDDEDLICGTCNDEDESEEDNVCGRCYKLISHTDKNGDPYEVYSDEIGCRIRLTREDCCPYGGRDVD